MKYKLKMPVIEKILANPKVSGQELQDIFIISKATLFRWLAQYNKRGLKELKKDSRVSNKSSGNKQASDEVYEASYRRDDRGYRGKRDHSTTNPLPFLPLKGSANLTV